MTPHARNQVVRELLSRLDHHSVGEREHAERVAVYATAIAHQMGYAEGDLLRIRYAAQLHDVGKVRVDAALLAKAGRLSQEELEAIQLHSVLALEIVARIDFLAASSPGIRHHHEWWDGTGYPDGLSGEDIPLDARIIGVAEAYDVLCQGAPWKLCVSPEEAIEELEYATERQFDARVVRALDDVREVIQPLGQHP